MSELGTINWIDNAIYTAAQLNAGQRRLSAELQDLLMHWLFDASAPGAGAGGVLGGLAVTKVAGQMQVTVSPGAAFYYDASLASPLSKFGLVLLRAATVKTLSDGDATNDRIDVISIESPTGTDNTESTLTYGGSPTNRATQRGAQPSVTVTEGTPAGSPSAPATPSGHLKLAEVLVKAGETDLDDAANVITDARVYSRGPVNRDDTPIRFHLDGAGYDQLVEVDVDGGYVSAFGWDQDEDWPVFDRQSGASGESADEHYPMLIDGGRTWWRRMAWYGYMRKDLSGTAAALGVDAGAFATDGAAIVITQDSTADVSAEFLLAIPIEERGLEIQDAEVEGVVITPFDGTVTLNFVAYYVDGTVQALGSPVTIPNSAASFQLTLTTPTPRDVADGVVLLRVFVSIASASSAVGELHLRSGGLQFKEGRA